MYISEKLYRQRASHLACCTSLCCLLNICLSDSCRNHTRGICVAWIIWWKQTLACNRTSGALWIQGFQWPRRQSQNGQLVCSSRIRAGKPSRMGINRLIFSSIATSRCTYGLIKKRTTWFWWWQLNQKSVQLNPA